MLRTAAETDTPEEWLHVASCLMHDLVPHDGATWFGMDPATSLATAPVSIEGVESGHCDAFWQREFLVDDVNLFRDLGRRAEPAGTLWSATGGHPARSARYREYLAPQAFVDELRAALRTGAR